MAHDGWRGGGRKGEAGPPARQGGREGSERGREAGGQGPPRTATLAPLDGHRGKVLSPPGPSHWGKRREETRRGPAGARGAGAREAASERGRDRAPEAWGYREQTPRRGGEEERRAEGTEGGTDGSLRRGEEEGREVRPGGQGGGVWLGAAGRKLGTGPDLGAAGIPAPGRGASDRAGCASEGHGPAPRHGPRDPLELLPLLPADHSRAGSQLPPSRVQPLHGERRGPQPGGVPGPERPSACQPPQVSVWWRGSRPQADGRWEGVGQPWVLRAPHLGYPLLGCLPDAGKRGRGSPSIRWLLTAHLPAGPFQPPQWIGPFVQPPGDQLLRPPRGTCS